ncbi:SPFH domain-containing protein [Dokdonella sp. MW10]|uniref:SPFH domain-containing protein n=1 Tax=Dokdonella sp. MW10 TaxID=2992926 RepID=UPI003F7D6B7D
MNERTAFSLPGIPTFLALLGGTGATVAWLVSVIRGAPGGDPAPGQVIPIVLLLALLVFLFKGLFAVQPNVGRVMQLFGRYAGTVRAQGLRWTNPLYTHKPVSLRVRNFESGKLKVNDSDGNPIEIGAIVVWQVVDTAEAVFMVDDYENFVHIQAESALRQMATSYPYDAHDDGNIALRSHGKEVNAHLRDEIQERLAKAGVEVVEARISHLAYAQEIAQAMLQRQQASAIVAARTRIVEGAVGMVELALEQLNQRGVVELDNERRAVMVSNLLVVLCGDRATQPVVNAGSLY